MNHSIINSMRATWWSSHLSYNRNVHPLGCSGVSVHIDLTTLVPLNRLLPHYEMTRSWPMWQSDTNLTRETLNMLARTQEDA